MNPTLEIFSQGEEVVTGQIVDTNAAWLSEQVVAMGFTVTRHTAVGDKLDDLIALLREISVRADCCICTGGLGPTSDDLTAEAVAKAFGLPLEFDAVAFEQIKRFYAQKSGHARIESETSDVSEGRFAYR
jgi:Predicted nucleotide-utilizing enzyme related to molybdopterin-biosynthesis enzyme MoeA